MCNFEGSKPQNKPQAKNQDLSSILEAADVLILAPILRADASTRINSVAVLYAEVRIGELMANVPKAQGQRTDIKPTDTAVGKYAEIRKAGFTPKQVERFQ